MSQKRTTTVSRNGVDRWRARRTAPGPEDRPAGRRFAPSLKNVTEGGIVYGALVAYNRARLELTQRELAARISVSPSTIERIEQGHPPGAEIREKLAAILSFDRPSLAHRVVTKIAPRGPMRRPRISLGSRWLWVGAAAVAIAVFALAVSAISGSGGTASSMQPPVAVSQVLAPPAAIHQARVQAQKTAAAEARAAERRREREAAAAAAAAAKKAAAKAARQSASAAPQPVTVAPSPAPSTGGGGGSGSSGPAPSPAPSTGGGGGSGSSGPAPELQHGIGAQGG